MVLDLEARHAAHGLLHGLDAGGHVVRVGVRVLLPLLVDRVEQALIAAAEAVGVDLAQRAVLVEGDVLHVARQADHDRPAGLRVDAHQGDAVRPDALAALAGVGSQQQDVVATVDRPLPQPAGEQVRHELALAVDHHRAVGGAARDDEHRDEGGRQEASARPRAERVEADAADRVEEAQDPADARDDDHQQDAREDERVRREREGDLPADEHRREGHHDQQPRDEGDDERDPRPAGAEERLHAAGHEDRRDQQHPSAHIAVPGIEMSGFAKGIDVLECALLRHGASGSGRVDSTTVHDRAADRTEAAPEDR